MKEIIDLLKKYTDGKKNTEKVEVSVLNLNRIIKALEQTDPAECGDCISRKEFEQRIKPYNTDDPMDKALYNFAHNKMIDCPSVEPERTADLTDNGIPIEEYTDCVRRKDVLWITKETGALETQARVVKLPSVEPERKTGKWVDISNDDDMEEFYCCSLCKREIILYPGETLKDYPYCHCGAKMEVENDD